MTPTKWIAAGLACALVAGALIVNPLWTIASLGVALVLAVGYVYFIVFRPPSRATALNEMSDHKWHAVDLGETTISGNGSKYAMYVRRGSSTNLIIHFSGGGACWDDKTASRPITVLSVLGGYTRDLKAFYFNSLTRLFPKGLTGLANRRDATNGFRDWNFVFIPYTTGDMHVGDSVRTYTGKRGSFDVHHNGRNNTAAALAWVFANFPDVGKVMVSGESSGAWASAMYAPLVADHFEGQQIYCLSDGVGLRSARWSDVFDRVWGADSAKNLGFDVAADVYRDALSHQVDHRRRNIKYLHSNTLYDDTLTRFSAALNDLPTGTDQFIEDWADHTRASMKTLAGAGLDYEYFLTDWGHNRKRHTTAHTLTTNELYNKCHADGVAYSQWLRRNVIDDEDLSLGTALLR